MVWARYCSDELSETDLIVLLISRSGIGDGVGPV